MSAAAPNHACIPALFQNSNMSLHVKPSLQMCHALKFSKPTSKWFTGDSYPGRVYIFPICQIICQFYQVPDLQESKLCAMLWTKIIRQLNDKGFTNFINLLIVLLAGKSWALTICIQRQYKWRTYRIKYERHFITFFPWWNKSLHLNKITWLGMNFIQE